MTKRESKAVSVELARVPRVLIDWLRKRPPGLTLVKYGIVVIGVAISGWALTISVSFGGEEVWFRFAGDEALPLPVLVAVVILGVGLVVGGCAWCWRDMRQSSRRRVIVVEVRGLRDSGGSPLAEAVPREVRGQRVPLLLDLRQGVADGLIVEPKAALEKIAGLPSQLSQLEGGAGRADTVVVYGGLAPVPLTFLTGILVDDEGPVVVMDWDRHARLWRQLDGADDGMRFDVGGLDAIGDGTREVGLVVSVSYRIGVDDVRRTVPGIPIVRLTLIGGTADSHWSEEKQAALGQGFFSTTAALGNVGVKRIHLFLAAPNSVVFRFGQLYDRRNLVETVVYQYEQRRDPPYPWGVRMPPSGETRGELVESAGR